MNKTKTFIIAAMLTLASLAQAQTVTNVEDNPKRQSVFLEWGCGSNGIGLNYEQRLKKDPRWGWRAGLSWGYSESSWFSLMSTSERAYTGSLGMNYLLGKGRSKLELGAGVNAGLYNSHLKVESGFKAKENSFGYYAYGNIGYRYQAKSGFQFRAGWSPITGFGTKHGLDSDAAIFYLSFGWAF